MSIKGDSVSESIRRRVAKPSHDDEKLAELLGAVVNLNARIGELQRGIRTLNGTQRVGAEPRNLTGSSQRLSGAAGRVAGFLLYNPAATSMRIRLHDGPTLDGDPIGTIYLGATSPLDRWLMPAGIGFVNGLFLEYVDAIDPTKPVEGAMYLAPAAPIT